VFGSRGMPYSTYVALAMQAPPVELCELVPYQYHQAGSDVMLMRYKARWRRSGPGRQLHALVTQPLTSLLPRGNKPHPLDAAVDHLIDRYCFDRSSIRCPGYAFVIHHKTAKHCSM
jgi:hypothetical protein